MFLSDDHKWRLYYKSYVALDIVLTRIINYASTAMLQIVVSLADDSRGIIYDCNMFIVQATGSTTMSRGGLVASELIKVETFFGKSFAFIFFLFFNCTARNLSYKSFSSVNNNTLL